MNLSGVSPHRDDLQTVIVVQVDMLCRNDHLLEIVLNVSNLAQKVSFMVVVDQGDGAR